MTENELGNTINDVMNALGQIVSETKKFANENIFNDGIFCFGDSWNDACSRKIGEILISAVRGALGRNLNMYDCEENLKKITDDLSPLIPIIEAASKELK